MWLLLLWGVRVSESHFKRPGCLQRSRHGGKGSLREVSHAKSSSCQLSLQLHVSSVSPLANHCLWISARHTILQPEAYGGHYPPVAAVTFTHLPFEMVNSHMGPKSSFRLFIPCGWSGFLAEGGLMIHHGKSKIAWTYKGYAGLKVWERGRWPLTKGRVTESNLFWYLYWYFNVQSSFSYNLFSKEFVASLWTLKGLPTVHRRAW